MNRRVLHVLGALAVVMVVAVLARPSQPDVPPPFVVDRETPEPDAAPTASPTTEPTSGPTADPTPDPATRPLRTVLTLHPVDGQSLEPVSSPATVHSADHLGARGQLSPDGRWLAVAIPRPRPEGTTLLRRYDTSALDRTPVEFLDPPLEVTVPAFTDWFSFTPEGDGLVWLENHERAGLRVGGVTFDGGEASRLTAVDLPPDLWMYDVAALRGGRVGIVTVEETGRFPARAGLSAPRLLVADLRAGTMATDLDLPLAEAMIEADETGRVELIPGSAWDVPRDRLYVAHADRDAVLVVDLAQGAVAGEVEVPRPGQDAAEQAANEAATAAIQPARALAQTSDTVYEGTWKEATLSGDGTVLYVHGSYLGPSEPPVEGQPRSPRQRVLPLVAVDVETLRAFEVGETPGGRVLAVSPQAEHVLVLEGDLPPARPPMLRLLDGRTLSERWHVPISDRAPVLVRFSDDGQQVAMTLEERGDSGDATTVVLYSTTTGEAVAQARFPGLVRDLDLDAGLVLTSIIE